MIRLRHPWRRLMVPAGSAAATADRPNVAAPRQRPSMAAGEEPTQGLTSAEVAERVARGQTNDVGKAPTRTIPQILRANLLTPFNLLLGSLLAVILVIGPLKDALFGGVLVANAAIGIAQELRAKRTLDRLALLNAPKATVIRDGHARDVDVDAVVLDDLLDLRAGDQVVVDGEVLASGGLELDESLLTGEADTVPKASGDQVLSGSFAAAGQGLYRATKVGRDAYAAQLAAEAKRFTLARSELRRSMDRIVIGIAFLMIPTAILLFISQLIVHGDDVEEAIRSTVGGTVAMVPEGLILLTSVAFAVAVVRLGQRNALVQELPAVEILARVDVVCVDKTGTITTGAISHAETSPDTPEIAAALGALAHSDPNPNATMLALRHYPDPGWTSTATVPFSSARKWSAMSFDGKGSLFFGAPEMLPDEAASPAIADEVTARAKRGQRVLVLCHSDGALAGEDLPPDLSTLAVVAFEDEVRPEAPAMLEYFADQGVTVKVISGDNPTTVAAVARRAGLAVADAVDARSLPQDMVELAEALDDASVFGRVTPHQKREMVAALQSRGHVVAMTGDGVNDVLALKDADIGVAMGTGAEATRAAAQIVLLDNSFASMPAVVAEGRRVINNLERVANLFLTKTTYAVLLALTVGVVGLPFPFLPRHLTLVGSLTIGIPAFFLALAPNTDRARPRFIPRVLRFAVPAGTLAAAATFAAYYTARQNDASSLAEDRTLATLTLGAMGLLVLVRLARPFNRWKALLVGSMIGLFAIAALVPFAQDFWELDVPPVDLLLAAVGIVALAAATWRLVERVLSRRYPMQ